MCAQAILASAGVLLWRQPQPCSKLCAILELLEIAHGRHHRRCGHRPNALELLGLAHLLVLLEVGGDTFVTPLDMGIKFGQKPGRIRPANHGCG